MVVVWCTYTKSCLVPTVCYCCYTYHQFVTRILETRIIHLMPLPLPTPKLQLGGDNINNLPVSIRWANGKPVYHWNSFSSHQNRCGLFKIETHQSSQSLKMVITETKHYKTGMWNKPAAIHNTKCMSLIIINDRHKQT